MINYVEYKTDVLVVGGGLAGISAAMEAAKNNVTVTLVVADKIFSGSSFNPYTWGLGIIAPFNDTDKFDLVENIYEVGCSLVEKDLSYTLVNNIEDRINDLQDIGVEFTKPDNLMGDNTLIPCFDKKHRKWYGFTFEQSKPKLYQKIKSLNIKIFERHKILKLIKDDGIFAGAIAINENNQIIYLSAASVVIASGGFGGLYKHNLNTPDINGEGLLLALSAGCELINLEFIQFIPGYIKPKYKTIMAERTFKFASLEDPQGYNILEKYLPEEINAKEVLIERSTHGPFTSRLKSKYVDIAIFKECLSNKDFQGVKLKYDIDVSTLDGLLIKEYFNWLEKKQGIIYNNEIIIAPFAHASNGGIKINRKAETNIPGIYAAGEATGGMHGADRIGGLSTANALVFGTIAGNSASLYAKKYRNNVGKAFVKHKLSSFINNMKVANIDPNSIMIKVKDLMWDNGNVIRNEEKLEYSIKEIKKMKKYFDYKSNPLYIPNIAKHIQAYNYIKLSLILLNVMLLRRESRGPHYREDYPYQISDFEKYIVVSQSQDGMIKYTFKSINKDSQ